MVVWFLLTPGKAWLQFSIAGMQTHILLHAHMHAHRGLSFTYPGQSLAENPKGAYAWGCLAVRSSCPGSHRSGKNSLARGQTVLSSWKQREARNTDTPAGMLQTHTHTHTRARAHTHMSARTSMLPLDESSDTRWGVCLIGGTTWHTSPRLARQCKVGGMTGSQSTCMVYVQIAVW